MKRCKHNGKFTILVPIETDGPSAFDELKKTDDMKQFLLSHTVEKADVSYSELPDDLKKVADEMCAQRAITYPEERCTDECGI